MGVSRIIITLLALFEIAVASETSQLVEIEVDGDVLEYSMSEAPSADSPIVRQEKDRIYGSLDLEGFVKDLGNVGKFVRIAYNGIGAAGPEFQNLQNKVQALGFDISKLCDKSAVTVSKFKATTRTILYELKAAYEFLLNNHERLALVSFSLFAELAEKMAVAAEKLEIEFELQEGKVRDLLDQTKLKGSREGIRIKEIKEQQERDKMNLERQEQLAREHAKLEAEFKAERLEAERKEDKAMRSKSGLLGRLGNMITSYYGLGNLFGDGSDAAGKANRYRQRSIEKLENEKEQRKLKQAAYQSMAELAHDIKMAEGMENLAIIAVEALGKASWSMKQLVFLLRQASLFWNGLKEHCREIAGEKIENFVADIAEEERRIYWSSMAFKRRMFQYMSKWVALHSVCFTHLEKIRHTQKDLHMYMREDPTYEESRKKLKELVKDFVEDLDNAHERISQQNFKSTQEIEELSKEESTELKDEL